MNIGVLGGSFDPVHNGHLLLAEEVRETFFLDIVYFIPTFLSPHKGVASFASSEHRLNMLKLAVSDNPYFKISDMEIKRGGKSYTIDTINTLYDSLNIESKIVLILGADLMPKIETWKSYKELINKVFFVVAGRDKVRGEVFLDKFPFISTLDNILFSVSSSMIRERIKDGKSIKYLVRKVVEEYIKIYNIYK